MLISMRLDGFDLAPLPKTLFLARGGQFRAPQWQVDLRLFPWDSLLVPKLDPQEGYLLPGHSLFGA
jgi:hypothetical protein